MSLQGLISGSECALPNNPLSQVLKHTEGDRSVQRDRIAGPSSSRLQHLPPASPSHASERDLTMARQFFDSNAQNMPPGIIAQHRSTSALPLELTRSLEGAPPAAQVELQDLWMRMEMQKHIQMPMQQTHEQEATWAAEFGSAMSRLAPAPAAMAGPSAQPQDFMRGTFSASQPFYQSPMGMRLGMGMYGTGMAQPFTSTQDQGKGKGKSRDEAFEAAFAQFAESQSHSESGRIEEVSENISGVVDAMRSTSLEEKLTENGLEEPVTNSDFQHVWDQLRKSDLPPRQEDAARWEAEFNQLMQSQRDELDGDYGTSMREAWENGMGAYDGNMDSIRQGMKFDEEGIPVLDAYDFDPNNKYLTSPLSGSHLTQAKHLLENNGSLTEAALMLEAAIQGNEFGEGGYETWLLLGEVRSMDEREDAGMRALSEGVRRAEEAGASGAGMISLAISFTNEGYERGSHSMLMRWLRARFPEYSPPAAAAASLKLSHWASRELVTDGFLAIARQQHSTGVIDPDVQTGLGVLFYTSGDFTRAKDCFETALSVRPKDYLLWNRLGSSLSNGNKPEEALGVYREALQLRPTYTRAIYNVGVACLNIGADKEAAEHFLSALALQDATSGDKSEQLWFTLRRAFIALGRNDLADRARKDGDVNSFRAEGFDF